MKIQLKQIWIARGVFAKLFNAEFSDIKLSYALSKIAKKINSEIEEIERARISLIKKYAEKDEKGNPKIEGGQFVLKDFVLKDQEKFIKEFEKFLETEIELDVWQIPWEAMEEVKLSPNEFLAVSEFTKIESKLEEPEVKAKI